MASNVAFAVKSVADNGTAVRGQVYPLGVQLLAFVALESDAPLVEVPIPAYTGDAAPKDGGIVWQNILVGVLRSTMEIIDRHNPELIIAFGDDCLVEQAPFAYLNERYGEKLGLI